MVIPISLTVAIALRDCIYGGTSTFIVSKNNRHFMALNGHHIEGLEDKDVRNTLLYKGRFKSLGRHSFGGYRYCDLDISDSDHMGELIANTDVGALAELCYEPEKTLMGMQVAKMQTGRARLLTTVKSSVGVQSYVIEIFETKDGVGNFRVIDTRYPPQLGEIAVSGMSGSPIIQNGKLVGVHAQSKIFINQGQGDLRFAGLSPASYSIAIPAEAMLDEFESLF
ncbi:MAG: hypothetical protein FWC00_04605 [Firmicutes bacterium]|nr:hypothetical protein [Bacillota bacterium]